MKSISMYKKSLASRLLLIILFSICSIVLQAQAQIKVGAERSEIYLPLLEGKSVGVVGNQTSILPGMGDTHLVDFLLEKDIKVKKVFVPEHGFRGTADAGEKVDSSVDQETGLPIVSLYGNNKKPKAEQLNDLDVVLFDLQDVGVRFYTYISTMHYVMEACAENGIEVIILDRPNPNGGYVDGPMLKEGFESFVGMHPIPVVHGLTVGELAQMINGEKWLKGDLTADLEVIPIEGWDHDSFYSLPVKPSPNLPNDNSISLYPSTCFFEGTNISVGRGTYFPFEVYGYPDKEFGTFRFTPVSIPGMAKSPRYQDKVCYGVDLRDIDSKGLFTIKYVLDAYQRSSNKEKFFTGYFNTLAGNADLQKMIIEGKSEQEIKASWAQDHEEFKKLREQYLIYK